MKVRKFVFALCVALMASLALSAVAGAKSHKAHHSKPVRCKKGHHRNGKHCVKNRPGRQRGAKGNTGAQGPIGPKGDNGQNGESIVGPEGPKGDKGSRGFAGPSNVMNVTTLCPTVSIPSCEWGWVLTYGNENASGPEAVPTLTSNGVVATLTEGGQYASIRHNVPAGTTFGSISKLSYSAGYTQVTDLKGGTPYFRIFLQDDVVCGGTGEDRFVFSANTQRAGGVYRNLSVSGDYRAFDVTAGTIRYNDDPGAEEATSTYEWDAAQAAFGSKEVCQIAVSMGAGGSYTAGATTTIGSVSYEALGTPLTIYNFGS